MIKYFWIPIVVIYFVVGLVMVIQNLHDYDSIDDSMFCEVWVAFWTLVLFILLLFLLALLFIRQGGD